MLSKKNRLTKKEVATLIQNSKIIRGTAISMRFYFNADQIFKVGVSVSKKILPTAVGRNNIKRNIYRIMFALKKSIVPANIFFSFIRKPNQNLIEQEIIGLLTKAKLLTSK